MIDEAIRGIYRRAVEARDFRGIILPSTDDATLELRGAWRSLSAIRGSQQPRFVPFNPTAAWTSVSSGATSRCCFDENAEIEVSEETFTEVPVLGRKRLTAQLHVGPSDIRNNVSFRDKIARELAYWEENALLRGDGHSGGSSERFSEPPRPRGLLAMQGISELDPINLSLDSLRRARSVYRHLNVGAVRLLLLIPHDLWPSFLAISGIDRVLSLDKDPRSSDDPPVFGNFDGVRFATTDALVPTDGLLFVNTAEWTIGDSGDFELMAASAATRFDGKRWVALPPDETIISITTDHDHAHRRPNQIVHVPLLDRRAAPSQLAV